MNYSWKHFLVLLSPVCLVGCIGGRAGVAANVALQVIPVAIKYTPKAINSAREAITNLISDGPATTPDVTKKAEISDQVVCSFATLHLSSEWENRSIYEEYVVEARRRKPT